MSEEDVNHRVSFSYTSRGWVPIDIDKHLYMCSKCKAIAHPGNEPDPCLGELVGVAAACCGHGTIHYAYVMCDRTTRIPDFTSSAVYMGDHFVSFTEEQIAVVRMYFPREVLYGRNAVVALLGWPRRRRPQEKGE